MTTSDQIPDGNDATDAAADAAGATSGPVGDGPIGYGYGPAAGGPATSLCVMLHGFGADGADLIPAAAMLGAHFPGMFFAAPNGPEPCVTDPASFQWYDPLGGRPLADHAVAELAPRINRYIDLQLERLGLGDEALVVLGFSQGSGVAIAAALRRAQPCAALLVFTGAVRDKRGLEAQPVACPPTLLVHGALDDTIPIDSLLRSARFLEARGVPTRTHVCEGIGHTMNEEGVHVAAQFLRMHMPMHAA